MIRQFSWVASGRVIAAVLQMVSLGMAAAWLGPRDFGLLAAVLGVAVIPQTVLDFGISTYVTRTRAADPVSPTVKYALRINNRSSLVLATLFGAGVAAAAQFGDPVFWLMLPLAVWVGSQRNADVWAGVALADGDAHVNVISLVGRRLLTIIIQLLFFGAGASALLGFSIGSAVGAGVSAVYVRANVYPRLPRELADISLKRLLRLTWPYWLHSAATQVRNLDTALVALIASPLAAGMYAVASRLTGPLRILPLSLATVLLPGLTRTGGQITAKVRRGLFLVTALLAVFYILLAVSAAWLVPAILGEEYANAVLPVQIVCLGLVFGAIASLLASVLQARGQARSVGYISLSTAVICMVTIALGAGAWGAVGASLGLVASFALQAAMMLIQVRRPGRGTMEREA